MEPAISAKADLPGFSFRLLVKASFQRVKMKNPVHLTMNRVPL
jgi:hypothetical protein